jgi:hypothetical protein
MENVIGKLEKKFPKSEIIISDGKIFLKNPANSEVEFVGYTSENSSGIEVGKNPLYKSSSWVNVSYSGIKSFHSFGKIFRRRKMTGTECGKYHARIVLRELRGNPQEKFNQKIRANRNETVIKNILDTGNHRGEILGKTDLEIHRKKRCKQILLSMKKYEEKIIPIK